ncbi:hypothetical protein JB92DRAFT_2264675 [Gautieria morchelliformis]|nr:hypothetical protein JB92DRAFT_2264675 [Gautieria morchelliformis]
MVSIVALQITFLVLQLSSAVLLTLLFATQYFCQVKRHPVVSALLVGDICRSLLGALPEILRRAFGQDALVFVKNSALQRTCGIDGLLYAYFLGVRVAFGVSFSFCILVMVRRAESPEGVSSELPRCLGIILIIAPYIWALPLILIPVPALVRSGGSQPPVIFNDFTCVIVFHPLFVVKQVLLWIPLGISVMLSVAIFFYILRFYYRHRNLLLSRRTPNFSLIMRLGVMTGLSAATAVFFSFVNASTKQNRTHEVRGSILWQSFATFLQFFFLVQSQVFRVWKGWAYRLVGRTIPMTPTALPPEPEYPMRPDDTPLIRIANSSPPAIHPHHKHSRISIILNSLHRVLPRS